MEASVSRPRASDEGFLREHWPILAGFVLLAIPTFLTLAQQEWSRERGVHEPLVIATGAWLIWREYQASAFRTTRGRPIITAVVMFLSLLAYTLGSSFDFLILAAAGLYGVGIACVFDLLGPATLKRLWFPLFYLLFSLPVPGWLLDLVTSPLKELTSALTTNALQLFGVPIIREGVTLFVAQYQLLVEDACAGLNAIVGLTSLGLFYAYLQHGVSLRYSVALMVLIVPIAVLANLVRVIALVLITLWGGNEAAQGYLHGFAGLVTFASGLLLVFVADSALSRLPQFRNVRA